MPLKIEELNKTTREKIEYCIAYEVLQPLLVKTKTNILSSLTPLICAEVKICGTSALSATQITKFGFFSNSHGRMYSFLTEVYFL